MGLLNKFFGSAESLAKEIVSDDEAILKVWKDYLETIPKKKAIIEKLSLNIRLTVDLEELRLLLITELTDIEKEEKEEKELISDLEKIEHSEKIKSVHKLERGLAYAESKYEYVYELLNHIHSILKSQKHIVEKIKTNSGLLGNQQNAEKLISHLKQQLELEMETIKKIEQIPTFHNLFLALLKGEHAIKILNSREKRISTRMLNQQVVDGITDKWINAVEAAIRDKVHEMIAEDILNQHCDADFEFINRPEFVEFAREEIKKLKNRDISEQIINAFVHAFRDYYNGR